MTCIYFFVFGELFRIEILVFERKELFVILRLLSFLTKLCGIVLAIHSQASHIKRLKIGNLSTHTLLCSA